MYPYSGECVVSSRDDFLEGTKRLLAGRSAYLCARPGCRKLTIGPGSSPATSVSIGSRHTSALQRQGDLASTRRRATRIVAQFTTVSGCAKTTARLVDANVGDGFRVEELLSWKRTHEDWVAHGFGKPVELMFADHASRASDLRLVAVSVEEDLNACQSASDDPFPRFDVKLRNVGSAVAFVHKVVVHVHQQGLIDLGAIRMRQVPVSATYDLSLRTDTPTPYDLGVPVSHAVPANDADRFQLRLGLPPSVLESFVREVLVYASLSVVFDEGEQILRSEPFVVSVPNPRRILGYRGGSSAEVVAENRRVLATFLGLPGEKTASLLRLALEVAPGHEQ